MGWCTWRTQPSATFIQTKPKGEKVLTFPTTEPMSRCTERKLVSDLRNDLKSHTLVLTPPQQVWLQFWLFYFSPSFHANTTISPTGRSHLISRRDSKPKPDSTVQVVAELGTPRLRASLRTQSEAQCAHQCQHTQLQEGKDDWSQHAWPAPKLRDRLLWPFFCFSYKETLFFGLWVSLTFFFPPQAMHVFLKLSPLLPWNPVGAGEMAQMLKAKAYNPDSNVHSTSLVTTVLAQVLYHEL